MRPDAAFYAAETLFQYVVYQRKTFRPAPLYGVFHGDVLVDWTTGKWHADRLAANCWDGELRVQYLGRKP